MPGTVLRYLSFKPALGPVLPNIAAQCLGVGQGSFVRPGLSDKYCAAISEFWAGSGPCFVQYRSTLLTAPHPWRSGDRSPAQAPGRASKSV